MTQDVSVMCQIGRFEAVGEVSGMDDDVMERISFDDLREDRVGFEHLNSNYHLHFELCQL